MKRDLTQSRRILAAGAAAVLLASGAAVPTAQAAGRGELPAPGQMAVDHDVFKVAAQQLREALAAARTAHHEAVRAALTQFTTDTTEERAALKAVLSDRNSTREDRAAALKQYRQDTKDERTALARALGEARAEFKAAREAAWDAFRAAVGR